MDQHAIDLWQRVLAVIKQTVGPNSYKQWFNTTTAVSLENNTLTISVPTNFYRTHLEHNYTQVVRNTITEVTAADIKVQFVLNHALDDESESVQETVNSSRFVEEEDSFSSGEELIPSALNPKYTFESFVVGEGNRFAHAASLAVAERPAKAYNPLFIYGGVGLGKTHLMNAIGHYILRHDKHAKVAYLSSEKFTTEFINAVLSNRIPDFKNKYRNVDALLIDDIQFLAGKEQTQEEFFHTFNTLYDANKQIVITSDRVPNQIAQLDDRLSNRFSMGLTTDIKAPDLETRVAILKKKARANGLDIPSDVLMYIAAVVDTNIRELEGALIRVVAYSSLVNSDLSAQLAVDALRDIVSSNRTRAVSISDIQRVVSEHFSLRTEEMKTKKRTRAIAFPRQIAMFLSRELTDGSLPRIGDEFGGRDHTTVIHACDKISKDLEADPSLRQTIELLRERLRHM